MSEIELHVKLTRAAKLCGISPDTLRRWLQEAGFEFNPGAVGRGHSAVVPQSVIQRIVTEHSVRLARI